MHPIGVLATDYNGRGGVLRSSGDQVFSMLLRRLLRACIFMQKGVLCEDDMIWRQLYYCVTCRQLVLGRMEAAHSCMNKRRCEHDVIMV